MNDTPTQHDEDAARLAALGYVGIQTGDEPVGELLPRLHLLVARRGHLHPVRVRAGHRRAADDLVAGDRGHRTVPGRAGVQRGRIAVPGRRWRLPVGTAAVGQEVGLDDRLGLYRGAADHHRQRDLRFGAVRGAAVQPRAHREHGHHLRAARAVAGHGHQLRRHQDSVVRGHRRIHRRDRRCDCRRWLAAAVQPREQLRRPV